jgi:hypothetical protein
MEEILARAPSNFFITLLGDFNFNMFKENPFKKFLEERGFMNQLGESITTDSKTQIDVVYSTSTQGLAGNYASYFSDHFAIFYQTEIDKDLLLSNKSCPINDEIQPELNDVEMEQIKVPVLKKTIKVKQEKDLMTDKVEYDFNQNIGAKIMYHNVDSFKSIKSKIKNVDFFWKSDVILISESRATSLQKKDVPKEYTIIYSTPAKIIRKKEGGFIVLCRTKDIYNFIEPEVSSGYLKSGEKWIINLFAFNIHNHCIITGFASLNAPFNTFKDKLISLLSKVPKEMFIAIIGYFNFNMMKDNPLKQILLQRKLINHIGNMTTTKNTQDGIVYSSTTNGYGNCFIYSLSNSAALLYQTEYERNQPEDEMNENIEEFMDVDDEKDVNVIARISSKRTISKVNESVNHNAKRQKNYDIIPLMPNGISFCFFSEQIRLQFLCTFNSFLHGITASYQLRPQFAAYIECKRKDYQYFDKMIEVMKITQMW